MALSQRVSSDFCNSSSRILNTMAAGSTLCADGIYVTRLVTSHSCSASASIGRSRRSQSARLASDQLIMVSVRSTHRRSAAARSSDSLAGEAGALQRDYAHHSVRHLADLAHLAYTGGTTGVSKGAVLLHRNLVANILQAEAWYQPALKKIPAGEQIVTVCALPIYHIFGFNTNMMLSMRMGGCNILIANPRDLPAVLSVEVQTLP